MKLKNIDIQNFRCFDSFKLDLALGVTVLIGKNGAGKSSLIQAIKHGMSYIFSKDNSLLKSGYSLSASSPALNVIGFLPEDVNFNNQTKDYIYPVSIHCSAYLNQNIDIDWDLTKKSVGGKLLGTLYKKAYLSFARDFKKNNKLPVLAYFSDSYPHIQTNLSKYARTVLESSKPIPRNFGYYQWDEETSCAQMWQRRFIQVWNQMKNDDVSKMLDIESLVKESEAIYKKMADSKFWPDQSDEQRSNILKEITEQYKSLKKIDIKIENPIDFNKYSSSKREILYITEQMKKFSKSKSVTDTENAFEIKRMAVVKRGDKEYIEFEFLDGQIIFFDQLPAGFRRLFSIVFDIAYRSFFLNPDSSEKAEGLVIIDEIDLHLHPSLGQEVLQRFQDTFPEIQFVVSTHSPLVISNFKRDERHKIVQMNNKAGKIVSSDLPDIFGIDYNMTVSDFMETPARNSTIEHLINSYVVLMGQNKLKQASLVLKKIQEMTGSGNEHIALEIEKRLKSLPKK